MTLPEYMRKIKRGMEMSRQESAKELNVNDTSISRLEKKVVAQFFKGY
jgi:DNA-binding XRE family transcriptional regulator